MSKKQAVKENTAGQPNQAVSTNSWQDSDGEPLAWRSYPHSTRLYYEAHITVPPLTEKDSEGLDKLCKGSIWHRSTFELHKNGEVPNGFVSARAATRTEILDAMAAMLATLQQAGFEILRFKVEDTLLDSKRGDTLQRCTVTTVQFPATSQLPLSAEQATATA